MSSDTGGGGVRREREILLVWTLLRVLSIQDGIFETLILLFKKKKILFLAKLNAMPPFTFFFFTEKLNCLFPFKPPRVLFQQRATERRLVQ